MSSKTTSFNEKLFFSHEISHTGTAATVKILRGKTARFLNFLGRSLSYTSTRAYGSFMISFGLLSIFLLLGKYYFSTGEVVALKQLIVGAVLLVASIPLLCFDRPMCVALQDFPLTDYILFEFFSIKRMHRNVTHASVSPLLALFLGFIPAIVGFFLPVQYVALTVALLIVAIVALTTPEFPMILTLLVLPYIQLLPHPNVILAVISAVSFLSFAIKVLLGKRVLYFDIYSVLILLAFLLVFIGGAAGGYLSFKNAVKVILFSLGYFPASSLIINRRLFDCAVNAIIVSSAPISVVAIVDFFTRKPAVAAFFPDSSTLAAYLTVSATLALAFAMQKHHISKKVGYLTVFFAEIFVLGLVMQPIIWLTLFLTALACLILTSRKLPAHLALGLLFAPYLILLIPSEKIDALFVTLKISPAFSEKLLGYKNAASAFFKNPKLISGIGSTSSVMPSASDTLCRLIRRSESV